MSTVFGRLRKTLSWLGPAGRVGVVAIVAAGLIAGWFSWAMNPLGAETGLHDLRAIARPIAANDERILLVTFDDVSSENARRRGIDRRILAATLRAIDSLQPRAIGIDVLFDQDEPDTDLLIAAMSDLRTPTFVASASSLAHPDQIASWQETYLRDLLSRVSNPRVQPASIALRPDLDGVMRRWPSAEMSAANAAPFLPIALSRGRNDFDTYEGPIAYRQSSEENPAFATLPAAMFTEPAVIEALRSSIEGKYVLIGGNFRNLDQFETPMTISGQWMTGLEIHAQLLSQLLDNRKLPLFPEWARWIAPILILIAGAMTGALRRGRIIRWSLIVFQIGLLLAFPFLIHRWTTMSYGLPAFGWLLAWLSGFFAVRLAARAARWEQGRLAESALHRYLPPEVAEQILDRPDSLSLAGEKKMVYILFSDLEGFTTLCHALPAHEVAILLNEYLERLSQVVLDHGGTIDKFVGDAVVAFWGAPFSRPDDGERAAMAAIAVHKAGEEFRREYSSDTARVGRTRVGLHYGEAVVGNFGGEGRIQYTALGDTMNVAARLESANKQLGTSVLVSKAAAEHSTAILYRTLGFITVRGRQTAVEVAEPSSDLTAQEVEQNNSLFAAASAGDRTALDRLEQWSATRPTDEALKGMIERIKNAQQGEAVVLQ